MATPNSDWSVDVDAECRLSWMTMAGIVTAIDLLAAQRGLAVHDRFDPSFALVLDLRMACELPLTWHDARTVVTNSPVGPRSPQAIVAGTIGTAAMAHAYAGLHDEMTGTSGTRVCRSLPEACAWLGASFDHVRDSCAGVRLPVRIR